MQQITALGILCLLGYIVYMIVHRSTIEHWGTRVLLLFVLGLVVCCLAASRDGLDKTIQYTIDQSTQPGLFSLMSIPTIVGCIGAFMIVISFIGTCLTHQQSMKEFWFYMMSSGIVLKVIVVETFRLLV